MNTAVADRTWWLLWKGLYISFRLCAPIHLSFTEIVKIIIANKTNKQAYKNNQTTTPNWNQAKTKHPTIDKKSNENPQTPKLTNQNKQTKTNKKVTSREMLKNIILETLQVSMQGLIKFYFIVVVWFSVLYNSHAAVEEEASSTLRLKEERITLRVHAHTLARPQNRWNMKKEECWVIFVIVLNLPVYFRERIVHISIVSETGRLERDFS